MAEPFAGQIQMFAFNYPPYNWAFCNGGIIAISQNQMLYSLLSNYYGGDGHTTFALPNLTSRFPLGFNMGNGMGLTTYQLGQMYGFQTHVLTEAQLAAHTHTAVFTPVGGSSSAQVHATTDAAEDIEPSSGSYLAKVTPGSGLEQTEKIYKSSPTQGSLVQLGGVSGGGSSDGTVTNGTTGSNQAFSIQNPFTAINFSIALTGQYPSRN